LRRLHSSSAVEKRIETVLKNKTFVGPKNPMWKGGPGTGYESGWRRARQQVWDRDKVCQVCLKPPLKTRRLDVHHIVRRRDGGTNDLSNLIGVHHVCHIKLENGKV
jgi:5-methylcytosine-specific restriction endonuclease McrA